MENFVRKQIRSLRLSLGETMEEFGTRFNTSKGTINNWEKGRNLPKKKAQVVEVNKFYSTEELKHFFSCLEDYGNLKFNAFFRILAFTGMRKGEALALEWSDIDFENKLIHITKGVSLDENDIPIISTPKTKKIS